MKKFILSIFVMAVLAPSLSRAEYVQLPLVDVGADQSGCVALNFAPGMFNPDGRLVIDPAQPGAKAMMAVALAAAITKKQVSVNREHRPASTGCYWNSLDYVIDVHIKP